jgi:MGT family glycosyltransferase
MTGVKRVGRSTVAFLNIAMHGRVNPTLPIVAELVRRGHSVTYHTSPAFSEAIATTGATVRLYPGGDQRLPDPPVPVTLLEGLARTAVRVLPTVLTDLRGMRPDLIVHDSACLWGAVAANELEVPAASSFTTFAFNRHVPSPTRGSWSLLAGAMTRPQPPRLPAVALGATPPLQHARVTTVRPGKHPPAAQSRLYIPCVPA